MANGDDETLDAYQRRRDPAFYAGATRTLPAIPRQANMATGESAIAQTPPLPPAEQQNYMPAIPRPPMTPVERDEQRYAMLHNKVYPEPKPTRLGRLGHTLNVIGQDIGVAVAPETMQNIPGTIASNRADLFATQNRLERERGEEARAGEEKTRLGLEERRVGAEEKAAGLPKMMPPGEETVRTETATGRRQNLWSIPGQPAQWVDEGGYPKLPQLEPLPGAGVAGTTLSGTRNVPTAPPPAAADTLPKVTTTAAQQPMAAPMPATPQYTYGKPEKKNEEEQFIDKWLQ